MSKHHRLHQKEITHGGARYSAELGEQHVRCESGEANVDDGNGDYPVGQNYTAVLDQLLCVITTTAAKNPELVQ